MARLPRQAPRADRPRPGLAAHVLATLAWAALMSVLAVGATMLARKLGRAWQAGVIGIPQRSDHHTITFLQQTDPWPFAIHLAYLGLAVVWLLVLGGGLGLVLARSWSHWRQGHGLALNALGADALLRGAGWVLAGVTLLMLLAGALDIVVTRAG